MKGLKALVAMVVLGGFFVFAGNAVALEPFYDLTGKLCGYKDTDTGLMWAHNSSIPLKNWSDAFTYSNSYQGCYVNGWHMPTIAELKTFSNHGAQTYIGGGCRWSSDAISIEGVAAAKAMDFYTGNELRVRQDNADSCQPLPVRSY